MAKKKSKAKKGKAGRPKDPNALDAVIPPIKCWAWQKTAWEKKAIKAGLPFGTWLKKLADEAPE